METNVHEVIKAISDAKPLAEKVRDAFLNLDSAIAARALELQNNQQKIKEQSRNGSRLTKHRFSL